MHFESDTYAGAVHAQIYVETRKIALNIIERMFYNRGRKKPEVLSIKVRNFLDQLNIEFIDSERARG